MGISWLYINRQPLPFRQKIVQVRMYAQAITIGALGASFGIGKVKHPSAREAEDEKEKSILVEASRYRFKEGSEAAKKAQEALDYSHQRKL